MERIQREQANRDTATNASHVAQGRLAQPAAQTEIASCINNSPRMIAQRRQLQSIFGAVAQFEKPEEETLQGKFRTVQLAEKEEEPVQGKFAAGPTAQLEAQPPAKPNNTGLPDNLKTGVESLSGMSMDTVKVHYNSDKPAQLNALAYTQGTDIHVAPGQERHLPHEAWHVVQQAQGRVQPTMQMREGVPVNDDAGLEHEADVMGEKSKGSGEALGVVQQASAGSISNQAKAIQCYTYGPSTTRTVTVTGKAKTRTFEECTHNSVEFLAGEAMPATGTATKAPAAWAGWLTNKKGGNNATQLHVVNRRWGGLGGTGDKNIVPGTPAENSHHLHQAEVKFDECFDGAKKAKNNCKYECSVTPAYGTAVNVSGGNVDYGDPTVVAKITDGGVSKTYPVSVGADGLTFKEGS